MEVCAHKQLENEGADDQPAYLTRRTSAEWMAKSKEEAEVVTSSLQSMSMEVREHSTQQEIEVMELEERVAELEL